MTTIREELQNRNELLFQRALVLIQRSKTIAVHAPSSFPTATSHGREHLETVEKIADMLLPTELVNSLNEHEIYFSLLAIYYHDLGMVGEEHEFKSEEGREKIRRQHAISVGAKIVSKWEELGFENENEARILAEICRGHRPDKDESGIANWNSFDPIKPVGPGLSVRLRLVSALIYAIDELHLGDDRAEERLKNWINIENDVSRMHWQRHSFISGPIVQPNGGLLFDATIKTFSCEDDLRRNVFAKAFSAVRDLNTQLTEEKIDIQIPKATIQWDRSELWKLLLIKIAGQESCATTDQLKEKVQESFDAELKTCFGLSDLCDEKGNDDEETRLRINDVTEQLLRQDILVVGNGAAKIAIDTSKPSAEFVGNAFRIADALDVLFKGEFAGNHEFDLHCSEFGKRLVAEQVVPLIKKHFGFDPCVHPNDHNLVEVLKASPSAARFAIELKPIPSDLVKRRLLATVVVAGFSRDCLQNPQLILEKKVRDAFRKIVELFTENFDRTIEFYEELALVGGFDSQKLSEILQHSDEWKEENAKHIPQELSDAKVSLSQQVNPGQPENTTLFPYFLLAGMHSGNHVELRCNYDSSITLNTSGLPTTAGSNHEPKNIAPSSIAVGPGEAQRLPLVDFRCRISLSPTSRKLSLNAVELSDRENHDFPLILSLPRPDLAKEGNSKIDFGFNLAKLTVRDALNLKRYSKLCDAKTNSEVSVSLLKTSKVFVTLTPNPDSNWSQNVDLPDELIEKLARYDEKLPLPWFILKKHEQLILESNFDSIGAVMKEIKKELADNKATIATFVLVQENEIGVPFREEWLGFFPGLNMEPPEMDVESNQSKYTTSDIAEMWNKREVSFKLETRLREDTVAIAKSFRDWADSEGKDDWPIRMEPSMPTFHQAKTIYSMIRQPFVDRFWYVEAPDELVVRPATHSERLETEMKYWASVNDHQREELIKEKLARIREAKTSGGARGADTLDTPAERDANPVTSKRHTRLDKRADKKRKRKLREKQMRKNRK